MVKIKPMKLFYKIFVISSIIILSIILFLILLLAWKMPYNNLYLKNFQKSFNAFTYYMHPKQSYLITTISETGNWGNGNQCQFFAGQFRLSKLSKETIMQSYFKYSMSSGVDFLDEDIFNHDPWMEWKGKYLGNYKPKEGENIYLVWMSDDNNPPDGDIRCH